ncbi:MAG TPA: glycosyltransferase family 1 protein [Acidimicrobiales bacterium]|nr:glycosyltransferase family 1 protein [Acidimicrobiales bacterium]
MARGARHRLVIDGQALVDDHFSGVGQYASGVLRGLDELLAERSDVDARIAVPVKRIPRLAPFRFRRIRPLAVPLPLSVQRRLIVGDRLPPMDRLFGRATYFFPNFVRWPLAGSPSVTAVHDLSFEVLPQFADADNGRFLRRAVRRSVERSDRVTALTGTMADEIATHYGTPRDRIDVVGCAVDRVRFYRRSAREVAEVTRAHGIYGDYVLSVGNIEPRKNQVRLIDAFCALPREVAGDLTLVLVGAGAWREHEIRARAQEAIDAGHRVKVLLGCVEDRHLAALYSGARCSAYVSVYEGFGMPPLESMACQTPVVVSDASVMPEVAGGAARLVDVSAPEPIAEGLRAVLEMDDGARAAMVERGLANVDRYDWRDSAQVLLGSLATAGGWAR